VTDKKVENIDPKENLANERRETGYVPWTVAVILCSCCIMIMGPAFGVLFGVLILSACYLLTSRTKLVVLFIFVPFAMLWGVALLLFFLFRP
jgi:hypothetical protein